MKEKFRENPQQLDKLLVNSVYRSLSRHSFFITFKLDEKMISNPISINTIGNDIALAVALAKTVWYPTFEEMKFLLIKAVDFTEDFSDDERQKKLENEDKTFVVGNLEIKEYVFEVLINNHKKNIYLIKNNS